MGIITAEAVYPGDYATDQNTISDLGVVTESADHRAATIFNGAMVASGITTLSAAAVLHRSLRTLLVTFPLALHGIGLLGVGFFPSTRETLHFTSAVVTFVSGGAAGILATRVQRGAFRVASFLFGLVALSNLALLALDQLGRSTAPFRTLGVGGVERWVAYPISLWLVAFGAYLTARRPRADA
jgi:hypothetical membrane protein